MLAGTRKGSIDNGRNCQDTMRSTYVRCFRRCLVSTADHAQIIVVDALGVGGSAAGREHAVEAAQHAHGKHNALVLALVRTTQLQSNQSRSKNPYEFHATVHSGYCFGLFNREDLGVLDSLNEHHLYS